MIFLENHISYSWRKEGNCQIIGSSSGIPTGNSLAEVQNYLDQNSGNFAFVLSEKDNITACTDTIRSFPLFYYFDGVNFAISNSVERLKTACNALAFNRNVFEEFKTFGHTLGKETLIENIYCMLPGEYLFYNKILNQVSTKRYFEAYQSVEKEEDTKLLSEELLEISENIFDDIVKKLNNKTAIIPLSAGYDSRFILAALIKKNYTNIICYTYGRADSYEKEIAEKVCRKLNVKWHFIEYDDAIFQKYLEEKGIKYETYSSRYTTIAHEQDYFAIQYLKEKELLPDEAVFLPGFCADGLAGSLQAKSIKQRNFTDFVSNTIFPSSFSSSETIKKRIAQTAFGFDEKHKSHWQNHFEKWFYDNKMSKFVTNAIRCFEYFGYEWQLPFWEKNFIEFWQKVPVKQKTNRKLYKHFLETNYFEPLEIDFQASFFDKTIEDSELLSSIKEIIPSSIKSTLKQHLIKESEQDLNNLNRFGQVLLNDVPFLEDKAYLNENQVHAAWLLYKLTNNKF